MLAHVLVLLHQSGLPVLVACMLAHFIHFALLGRASRVFAPPPHSRGRMTADSETMPSSQELALPRPAYTEAVDIWNDIRGLVGDMQPQAWMEQAIPETSMANYNTALHAALAPHAEGVFEAPVDERVFEGKGAITCVPLNVVNFRQRTQGDNGESLATCWRHHSKCRIMAVVEN